MCLSPERHAKWIKLSCASLETTVPSGSFELTTVELRVQHLINHDDQVARPNVIRPSSDILVSSL